MSSQDKPQENTVVLDIAGKVTIGHDAKMREAIAEAVESGAQNVLLNLSGVTSLDSSGIGELVAAHASIQKAGGRLLLVELPEKVSTVLQITNLMGILELYDNVDQALEALKTGTD